MNILDFIIGPTFGKILDKIFPDQQAKQAAQLQILQMTQAGEFKDLDVSLQSDLAQDKINEIEAQSASFWKSGARPAVLWLCVLGLAYSFLALPLLTWASNAFWHCPVPPALDMATVTMLISSLLGISTQRHLERKAGVA